jgi:hypothetical protein
MLKPRYVILGLVLLLWLIVDSWGQSQRPSPARSEQNQTQSQQQEAAPDQRGTEQLPLIVQPLPTKKSTEITAREARDTQEKRNADWWTWLLSLLTVAALFGQIMVLWAQAYFLKGTLDVTRTVAASAEKSSSVAERTLIITQRAFVSLKQILSSPCIDDVGIHIGWNFQVEWENRGPTPAKNLQGWISARYFNPDIPDDFDFLPEPSPELVSTNLAPNGIMQTGHVGIALADISQAKNGIGNVYIWARCDYNDVFDNTPQHHTLFAAHATIPGNPAALIGMPFLFLAYNKHTSED